MLQAGQAVERVVPGDALAIVADDYGVTSPLLLYFAHRKGWSFDVEDLHPQVIDGLKRQGRAVLREHRVVAASSRSVPRRPAYLRFYRQVGSSRRAQGHGRLRSSAGTLSEVHER